MDKVILPKQTRLHLAQAAALAVAKGKEGTPSVDTPVMYTKDVLSLGSFKTGAGSQLKVEPKMLDKIISDSNRYLKNGNSIEYIANHTSANNKPFEKFDNSKENKSVTNIGGYCSSFRPNDDGNWATCDIGMTTEGGVKLAQSSKDVSIELDFDYEDTQGNKYDAVIRRVAGVQKPVIPGQSGYKKKMMLSEYFAETETFVLTTTNQEESNMGDQTKEKVELNEEEAGFFRRFMKSLKLSEDANKDGDAEKKKTADEKAASDMADLKASLEASEKSLADEQKKSAKANKALETSAIAGLVGAAKSFTERLGKLNIDTPSKDKLAVALGIDEDPEKMNKVFLSEDEDGKVLANDIIDILENVELISTSDKTHKLSEYHEKSDGVQQKEDDAYIKEKAEKSKANLGYLNKEKK